MELRHYWVTVRSRLWLIVLSIILAASAAFLFSAKTPSVYRASTTLLVNISTSSGAVGYNDLMASERIAQTNSQLVKARAVMEKVVNEMHLPQSPEQLEELISVQVVRNTQLLQVTVDYNDPVLAKDIANKTAEVFIAENSKMQRSRLASPLDDLTKRRNSLEQDIKTTNDAISALQSNSRTSAIGDRETEIERLQTQLAYYQNQQANVLKTYDEMLLTESRSINILTVAEPAVAPITPIKPRPMTDTLLGAVAGLLLGIVIVFGLEYLDDTVKTSEDVERSVGLATLAHIGFAQWKSGEGSHKKPLVSKSDPKSPFLEAYRVLRTNIQYSTVDNPPKILMVTSSLEGEGKTTTAL